MILRKIIPSLILYLCTSPSEAAQEISTHPSKIPPSSTVEHTRDFSETIVPITSVRLVPSINVHIMAKPGPKLDLKANFGTGFCLDAACRFIVTNYHVAATTRTDKIKGERIIQRYLATSPSDQEATANLLPTGDLLPYAKKRDLAIFELRRSLPHHHGLTFSLEELEVGQEVDIYGYPKGSINPIRKPTRFPAAFKGPTTSGLLAFEYQLSGDKAIRLGGTSGGIVVDRRTEKILGILCGANETVVAAVPVQTLAEFVSKVQPFLAQRIFPVIGDVSPLPADLYPKFAPLPDHNSKFVPVHVEGLQRRLEEPPEVKLLRSKAQLLADSMRNFIAVQGFAWGSGEKEPSAEASYEVRVIDGVQKFRSYPDGKVELQNVPFPRLNDSIRPGGEWSELPAMVGTELRLRIHQAADVVVNDRRMKVFQYWANIEDGVCKFESISDFVFYEVSKVDIVDCYGEVWTDEDTNILRMSKHYELPGKWKHYQGVVTYGWLQQKDEAPRLIPLTIYTQVEHKQPYWCRGQFTDYRRFGSEVKIIANSGSQIP
jgi:hypothetical protein